jgi:hypothetical protein
MGAKSVACNPRAFANMALVELATARSGRFAGDFDITLDGNPKTEFRPSLSGTRRVRSTVRSPFISRLSSGSEFCRSLSGWVVARTSRGSRPKADGCELHALELARPISFLLHQNSQILSFPIRDLVRAGMREFDPSVCSHAVTRPRIAINYCAKTLHLPGISQISGRSPSAEIRQPERESAESLRPACGKLPF